MEYPTFTFTAPSGHEYTIREQNGQDEEILTKASDVRNFMNLSKFLQAILIKSSRKEGKLTLDEVMALPLLDRYTILFQARIFSLGNNLEIPYKWPTENGGEETLLYDQDLSEYLLPYGEIPHMSEEEVLEVFNSHPDAIPMYPYPGQEKDIVITLKTGKKLKFDLLDGNGERAAMKLTEDENTRNAEFIVRNLHLEVDGKWDRVRNFSLFTRKEMAEMRKLIHAADPNFAGTTKLTHPRTGEVVDYLLLATTNFFFPEDVD